MSALVRRLRPPSAMANSDEAAQVWNEDVEHLSRAELVDAMRTASRIAARDPRAIVWRGMARMTVRDWAEERISLCLARLVPQPGTTKARPKGWL